MGTADFTDFTDWRKCCSTEITETAEDGIGTADFTDFTDWEKGK